MDNRRVQNITAAVVFFLAIIALFSENQIEDWLQGLRSDNRPAIAQIDSMTSSGGVKYRLPESLTYHRARTNLPLHAKDTVSTDAKSSAVISFKSGLKVELEPNSLMIVEDTTASGGNLELTFLRGNVRIINQVPGIKLSGLDLSKVQAKKEPQLKVDIGFLDHAPTAPTPPPVQKIALDEKKEKRRARPTPKPFVEKETLPDSYIASVIRNQRTFLNRCYAQHLRLNPDARGRIDTSLTIEPDGTISTARVIGSTIADPALQQCVVSTLQRARFKAFNGDPIIVQYPINFE